jgi:hypothetical protein
LEERVAELIAEWQPQRSKISRQGFGGRACQEKVNLEYRPLPPLWDEGDAALCSPPAHPSWGAEIPAVFGPVSNNHDARSGSWLTQWKFNASQKQRRSTYVVLLRSTVLTQLPPSRFAGAGEESPNPTRPPTIYALPSQFCRAPQALGVDILRRIPPRCFSPALMVPRFPNDVALPPSTSLD